MSVFFHSEDRELPGLKISNIIRAVKEYCLEQDKKAGNINFIYCSDEYLLNINKEYLEHDYYTDVITFNYCEGKHISGDIFMSRDRVEDNADKLGADLEEEFIRVCAHGLLHLLGFNDGTDVEKALMRKNE